MRGLILLLLCFTLNLFATETEPIPTFTSKTKLPALEEAIRTHFLSDANLTHTRFRHTRRHRNFGGVHHHRFRGPKLGLYLTFPTLDDSELNRHFQQGDADFGYAADFEQSFGWLGFQVGADLFISENDNFTRNEVIERGYRGAIMIGLPLFRAFYPNVGFGYRVSKITSTGPGVAELKEDNSGNYWFAAVDVRLIDELNLTLRYEETNDSELFNQDGFRVGLKVLF